MDLHAWRCEPNKSLVQLASLASTGLDGWREAGCRAQRTNQRGRERAWIHDVAAARLGQIDDVDDEKILQRTVRYR